MLGQREELTIEDYLTILRRRWPLILLLAVVGVGLGYAATYAFPKRYSSTTLILVQQPTVPPNYVQPVVSGDTDQWLVSMQQQILSRSGLEPVIRQFGLYSSDINKVSMDDLVGRLRKAITVTPVHPMAETRSAGLPGFTVSVELADPHLAQQICSFITSMFMEENLKRRQQMTNQTTDFISQQLDDAKAQLDVRDAKLAAFQRRYFNMMPDQEHTNIDILTSLNGQLDATTQGLSRTEEEKAFTQSMLSQELADWQATNNGQNPNSYRKQLNDLETQLIALKSQYTDSYPDVIKTKNDIAALKKKIAALKNSDSDAATESTDTDPLGEPPQIRSLRVQIHQYDLNIKSLTAKQENLQDQIKAYQARVQSSPEIAQQYTELTRDYKTALDFYNNLLKKRDDANMASNLEVRQEGEQFQVLDPANLPDKPSFPDKIKFSLGGLAGGLALGFGLTFLLEFQDTSFRTERDVETLLHLPVLAMVPAIKPIGARNAKAGPIRLALRA
jgi:protein tyrosine kinase modulator